VRPATSTGSVLARPQRDHRRPHLGGPPLPHRRRAGASVGQEDRPLHDVGQEDRPLHDKALLPAPRLTLTGEGPSLAAPRSQCRVMRQRLRCPPNGTSPYLSDVGAARYEAVAYFDAVRSPETGSRPQGPGAVDLRTRRRPVGERRGVDPHGVAVMCRTERIWRDQGSRSRCH
jgi:hypothetical protein